MLHIALVIQVYIWIVAIVKCPGANRLLRPIAIGIYFRGNPPVENIIDIVRAINYVPLGILDDDVSNPVAIIVSEFGRVLTFFPRGFCGGTRGAIPLHCSSLSIASMAGTSYSVF
mgnify:CR=1 FL=1